MLRDTISFIVTTAEMAFRDQAVSDNEWRVLNEDRKDIDGGDHPQRY
jgi:hypothetical protein